jgi:DNA-binding NarL/FixJ family response regulator
MLGMRDAAATPVHGTGSRSIRLVLVEDHLGMRERLVQMLSGAGMDVLAAVTTLDGGCHAALSLSPDLMVIDNQLPDGQGIDLCHLLGDLTPDIPTVIHSGTLTERQVREALSAGACEVVVKSASPDALLRAIRRHAAQT